MSVQFGQWSLGGTTMAPADIGKLRAILAPFGPDGETQHTGAGIQILYSAFHTTEESLLEVQPFVSPSGRIFVWDGRLDNRPQLINHLNRSVSRSSPDVAIVAAAHDRWGNDCFAQLTGDWAVSIFDPLHSSLVLGTDFIGSRHLYYSANGSQIRWSTLLEALLGTETASPTLNEEYIAGWLSSFPASHLTPYLGIHAVPPCSYVVFRDGVPTLTRYSVWSTGKAIRHKTDAEYEDHFREVFGQSVRRRLRSHVPVCAELSGGMDSSSIVCMADSLLSRERAITPRLETLSYYDDSEPHWNERPYFSLIETRRGRPGCHIDAAPLNRLFPSSESSTFSPTPRPSRSQLSQQFADFIHSHGIRVVLSGIGGDEVLGGVPTPIPEFADLLSRVRLLRLGRQMVEWAIVTRTPLVSYAAETVRAFLPPAFSTIEKHRQPANWLQPEFVLRYRSTLEKQPRRLHLFGELPSFQESLATLDDLRRQIASSTLAAEPLQELRYPYLDRELLEFLFTIPREQLLRPRQRRSLMRRAMAGIVPDEILGRRRKAFVARGPLTSLSAEAELLQKITKRMVTTEMGIVDSKAFSAALETARRGGDVSIPQLTRTLIVEEWLRGFVASGGLAIGHASNPKNWNSLSVGVEVPT
jgi:asparagine synthase (glutamine-hydrolysing)